MGKHMIFEIRGHLGYKFDLQQISALAERWRPETHTFHLPCGACTIALEDRVLQLGLPVERPVIIRSGIVSDKVTPC
ncbi:hypothetical protein J1N35_040912 [Gossypium stocksii]|uniref:Aminotransferase-like plant mobile domain-containing protein n=1 Tax=Gossypium stocksii TaxID=47602 RepID=A0A9D3UEH5_9ROSI|nr:hypothetical protein J1N35_040912 [Gossypium stocksii]